MKTFYRCVWGMMVSLLCGVGQANADSSSLDSIQTLGEVMVTANRYNEVIPSQKLTGKELKALNSFSVADAIRYFSGLQIKDYGGVGGLKTVNIRSMGTNHMGVYYNGIQLGNAQNGQVDLGKFSLENIEEISLYNGQKSEIFQSAREFGSAGSIYLTTRRPKFKPGEKSHLKASVKAGSFDLLNPSVLFEYKLSETVSMTFNSEWINSSGKYKFRYRRVTPSGETAYDTTATRKNGDIDAVRFEGGLQGYLPNGYWKAYVYHYSSERGIPGAIVNNVWRNGERMTALPVLILILLVLVAASIFEPGLWSIILILGLVDWPGVARLVRGNTLSLRESNFIKSSQLSGMSRRYLLFSDILPNTIAPVLVYATSVVAISMLDEAALSFLGMGVQPPVSSLGSMLNGAESLTILTSKPWLWVPPGVVIILLVVAINFIGDALRDALDPTSV